MAGCAICQPIVTELGSRPSAGGMALRALPSVVVYRCIFAVARFAIGQAGMAHVVTGPPCGRRVTVGALPSVVRRGGIFGMAGDAIRQSLVRFRRPAPAVRVVARRALSAVMIGGCIARMARSAVGIPIVLEG